MATAQPQPDSQPARDSDTSFEAGSPNHADLLAAPGLETASAQPCQIENTAAQTDTRQNGGTSQSSIQDHAQWSGYLQGRRILEAAMAAGAWVEYSDYFGLTCLVWQEKRRDGSRGARRRRFIDPPVVNGRQYGKSIWFKDEKTDEPFHYAGTLDDLKREIARAGGWVYVVEGEFGVWSLQAMGIRNVIGIYGISNIPKDIAAIFTELGVAGFSYLADNDKAGATGASTLRALLRDSDWKGEGEYRQFKGAGIPDKGDANDLLCHHYPDLAAARAALEALPRFEPDKKPEAARKSFTPTDSNQGGWGPVNDAITNRLGLGPSDFKASGYTKKNFRCLNPHHDDKTASAGWSRDGFYKCFSCGEDIHSYQVAEWLGIDWRALRWPQRQISTSKQVNLNAAPGTDVATAPLSFTRAPDSWLRTAIQFYTPTAAALFPFALALCTTGPLAQGFLIDEFIEALRPLGCNLKADTIKKFFKNEVFEDDNHPFFGKVDPCDDSRLWNCKFRLRPPDDIRRRLANDIRLRVYEEQFAGHPDILIGFEVFDEALSGSDFPKMLKSALEPLYREQKSRLDSLIHKCEGIIAGYLADLDDLSATPLPDWTIDKPSEVPALLARGIYDDDPEDRSKAEWSRLLGISEPNVNAVLERAGIRRQAITLREEVASQRQAKDRARELGAKIIGIEVDGSYQPYDAAMDLLPDTTVIFQPPAKHEIVSDEKPVVTAPPTKPRPTTAAQAPSQRADNMRKPGNWHQSRWDPQFIYWELVKACCLLRGYIAADGIGIYDPRTSEVWTNPTLDEVARLIIGDTDAGEPDPD